MKANVGDVVRLTVAVKSDFSDEVLEPGLLGDVVEVAPEPYEAYLVDVGIPDETLAGGYRFSNVRLAPDQFGLVMRYVEEPSNIAR